MRGVADDAHARARLVWRVAYLTIHVRGLPGIDPVLQAGGMNMSNRSRASAWREQPLRPNII